MLDPADIAAGLQPGDKLSFTFHKAKADPNGAGSFLDNARTAGLVPGGTPGAPVPAPPPAVMAPPPPMAMGAPGGAPLDPHRAMLVAALRHRIGSGI